MKAGIPFIAAFALLPCGLHADHADFVVINATASKAYTQKKFVNGVPQSETYVFYEGKYFGGSTHDPSIAHATFMDIAKILAPNLAKQNYLPTKNAKAADLLIVVNWGTTITDDTAKKSDSETQFQLQQELSDIGNYNTLAANASAGGPMAVDKALGAAAEVDNDFEIDGTNALSAIAFAHANADLLGYSHALNKEMATASISYNGMGAEAESHMADLDEERYFVILLAYDYQKILNSARKDEGWLNAAPSKVRSQALPTAQAAPPPTQPLPVWEVRMNIRAAGNNFTEALPAMSKVAADFFGKQENDLKTEQTNVGKFWVEVGPVKVISTGGSRLQK